MTESDVVAACDKIARQLGWDVESYSDARAVRTCPGLSDRRYVQRARGHRVWVEAKAPDGKLTREQHAFLRSEQAAGAHALAVDDPAQLQRVLSLLSRDMGRGEALRYCGEVTAAIARKGYRGEKKGAA